MSLLQVIYASRPFGYDDGTLRHILSVARTNNVRDGITGSLVCREDLFLQLLEGPAAEVEAAFARIARDDRHIDVDLLVRMPTNTRMFATWAMRHDPARSWMWTAEDVANGAVARATPADLSGVFARVSAEPAPVCVRALN
ncbi:MAG: BLUF domain-containing protein [Hyphomicrobiaceae bacterium]|nr:BLUF domain-containing protein [Hyphomicrobiaceae bacterium]